MAFLASEAFGFDHRHALQADLLERFLHVIELEWFDDRLDFFSSEHTPLFWLLAQFRAVLDPHGASLEGGAAVS